MNTDANMGRNIYGSGSMEEELELRRAHGFSPNVKNALRVSLDWTLYAIGSSIVLQPPFPLRLEPRQSREEGKREERQIFLRGHESPISALTSNGKLIASGEKRNSEGSAEVRLWLTSDASLFASFKLHKVAIQALSFSPDSRYLAVLGGEEDNRSVILYDVNSREGICRHPAKGAKCVRFLNCSSSVFALGGDNLCDVCYIEDRKIVGKSCRLGRVRRNINCFETNCDDSILYCGTSTGDVMTINLSSLLFITVAPTPNSDYVIIGSTKKKVAQMTNKEPQKSTKQQCNINNIRKMDKTSQSYLFRCGVTYLRSIPQHEYLLVGGGDGRIGILDKNTNDLLFLLPLVEGGIASIDCILGLIPANLFEAEKKTYNNIIKTNKHNAPPVNGVEVFVSTVKANIYKFLLPFNEKVHQSKNARKVDKILPQRNIEKPVFVDSSHDDGGVSQLLFPKATRSGDDNLHNKPQLFISCGQTEVRIWDVHSHAELKRIRAPGVDKAVCLSMSISDCGAYILTGWSDSAVRGYGPESGSEKFKIENANLEGGVTSILCSGGAAEFIVYTGGQQGEVRSWRVKNACEEKTVSNLHSRKLLSKSDHVKNSVAKREAPKKSYYYVPTLLASMKEHKAAVKGICLTKNKTMVLTISADGSAIGWSTSTHERILCLFSDAMLTSLALVPITFSDLELLEEQVGALSLDQNKLIQTLDETQLLTVGSDRKVSFWDIKDGQLIRSCLLPVKGELTCIVMGPSGAFFAVGSKDGQLLIYSYVDCLLKHRAVGHSAAVTSIIIDPAQTYMISSSKDGAILSWTLPAHLHTGKRPSSLPQIA